MTQAGYVTGYLVHVIVTIAFLGAAAAAIRYGWDRAGHRRDRQDGGTR